jgi:hypothetical protein
MIQVYSMRSMLDVAQLGWEAYNPQSFQAANETQRGANDPHRDQRGDCDRRRMILHCHRPRTIPTRDFTPARTSGSEAETLQLDACLCWWFTAKGKAINALWVLE